MSTRVYHNPRGNPCDYIDCDGNHCGLEPRYHRVAHSPREEPCIICGLGRSNHYRIDQPSKGSVDYYVGIDGEGQGREDHRYVMLAWSSADGSQKQVLEALPDGRLSTVACLDFILAIPNRAKIFAFAFGYDLTKLLQDVDDPTLYLLYRPELRKRKPGYEKFGPKPVPWGPYSLNKVGSKFVVAKGKRRRVVWDIFAFFQSKFTTACEDWKIAPADALARMRGMKDQRAEFDKLGRAQILSYCFEECAYMAALAEKLVAAHEQVGLKLRAYHGAGSSASAILKKLSIDKMNRDTPKPMQKAVASAFFGGRFENSVIGEVPGPLWSYDISSAYPYQLTFLPCLDCGSWSLTKERGALSESARQQTAVVRYQLPKRRSPGSWGALPFRLKDGSIAFPSASGGGWVWRDEFLAAEPLGAVFREAWIYRTDCDHRPFGSIPEYYLERLRIGKEGPGIVIKLAINSVYGKLAQSVGTKPPFQSWIWAGMVTSGCRAQILQMLALHKDPANLLMVATDGIYTREKLKSPIPRDTGTGTSHNKPLGGWECKSVPKGMFAARPGIYFPLDPTEDELKQVRARGVGRATMLATWRLVVDAWKSKKKSIEIANVTRFFGAKSSISRSKDGFRRSDRYGQWRTRPIELSFDPLPKRGSIRKDGTLRLREFPHAMTSFPYDRSLISAEALLLKMATQEALEQPDGGDFTDYETET